MTFVLDLTQMFVTVKSSVLQKNMAMHSSLNSAEHNLNFS